MSKPITSYTIEISSGQADLLRRHLESEKLEFVEKPYALFSAQRERLNVTVYEKGPKVLVQGRDTTEFVQTVLEPDILGEARLGLEETLNPEMFEPHFGVDESGKGDYFGPLVIAGVFVNTELARHLIESGVADSKRITSDARIRKLSEVIRSAPGISYHVISIEPERYNSLYEFFGNVNRMLAWGHAAVIEHLLSLQPDCPRALSDQFTNQDVLLDALQEKGRQIQLVQRTKAESDIAVAAASILARETFIDWMDSASDLTGIEIARGASNSVKVSGKIFVRRYGTEKLTKYAKLHFQTSESILRD
ncbi:UNVERIFIED_CONTAM: hypothetical protein GTU68_046117 [Idotea baltica]|nr:hypothetical protein [Idotea baltica]